MGDVTIGSLFTGAGALCELAVARLLGGRVVWHCENDPAASRMLAHRFPSTPNLGDITAVDWPSVPPVRVMTGGFPCTDVSSAGQRAGLRPGTRSGLWSHMAYAIGQLRPELVVIENVRGLASAPAHCDVEPCSWCLGDRPDKPAVRAFGAVLGDLADLGYDAAWCGLRASDVGAPHPRFRFVILAAPAADAAAFGCGSVGRDHGVRSAQLRAGAPADVAGARRGPLQQVDVGRHGAEADGGWPAESGRRGGAAAHPHGAGWVGPGLPGPDLRGPDGSTAGRDDHETLLPTRRATDGTKGRPSRRCSSGDLMLPSVVATLFPTTPEAGLAVDWGIYAPAVQRWAAILGRPAPYPRIGKKLNPALTEWMMGWPAGWVTQVPGLTPNEQVRLCGNGVVPHQITQAVRYLLPILSAEGSVA